MWQSNRRARPGRIEIADIDTLPAPVHPAPKIAVDEDGLISVASLGDVAVVFVQCTALRERQAQVVQEKLTAVAERCRGRIAASLAAVQVMTSAGVNALLAVHLRCETLGGRLALFALSEDLARMLRVTKLDRKLIIAATAHEAVRAFALPHGAKKRSLWSALRLTRQQKNAA